MTLHYPDISAYNKGIAVSGAAAVCIKATEGTGWLSSDYSAALTRAHNAGVYAFAYHFLHQGNGAGQAGYCLQHVGPHTGLMLDFEPSGDRPGLADAIAFVDAYRRGGGLLNLCYLPHWYWQQLGSPPLGLLAQRRLSLVSSAYTAYSDGPDGAGWQPYGGLTPAIWQWTDRHPFNGQAVDFNAYRGTLDQLRTLAGGTVPPVPPAKPAPPFPYAPADYLGTPSADPHCHSGYYGGPDTIHVHDWQTQMTARGWHLTQDGRYGTESDTVARLFQAEKGLTVDGKTGPATWAASWTAPVTVVSAEDAGG